MSLAIAKPFFFILYSNVYISFFFNVLGTGLIYNKHLLPPLKEIADIVIQLLTQYSRPSIQQNTYNYKHSSNFVVSDDVIINKTVCLQQYGKLKGIHYTKRVQRWRTVMRKQQHTPQLT